MLETAHASTTATPAAVETDAVSSGGTSGHVEEHPAAHVATSAAISRAKKRTPSWGSAIEVFPGSAIESPTQEKATSGLAMALVANWLSLRRAGLPRPTYRQICEIAVLQDGWLGPGSRALAAGYLSRFLECWSKLRDRASPPDVVLRPNGMLQVEWYRDDRHFVELCFEDDLLCHFAVFDGNCVSEGIATDDDAIDIVQAGRKSRMKWRHA